jgi:hypothetical protein
MKVMFAWTTTKREPWESNLQDHQMNEQIQLEIELCVAHYNLGNLYMY